MFSLNQSITTTTAITRVAAHHALTAAPAGTYVLRSGEQHGGYTLSFRTFTKVKHYVVHRTPQGTLRIFASQQRDFWTVAEMINFYTNIQPLSPRDNLCLAANLTSQHRRHSIDSNSNLLGYQYHDTLGQSQAQAQAQARPQSLAYHHTCNNAEALEYTEVDDSVPVDADAMNAARASVALAETER